MSCNYHAVSEVQNLATYPLVLLLAICQTATVAEQVTPTLIVEFLRICQPTKAVDPVKIQALVRQLGDDQWAKRERATQELILIGQPAREAAMEMFYDIRDAEILIRLKMLEIEWDLQVRRAGDPKIRWVKKWGGLDLETKLDLMAPLIEVISLADRDSVAWAFQDILRDLRTLPDLCKKLETSQKTKLAPKLIKLLSNSLGLTARLPEREGELFAESFVAALDNLDMREARGVLHYYLHNGPPEIGWVVYRTFGVRFYYPYKDGEILLRLAKSNHPRVAHLALDALRRR